MLPSKELMNRVDRLRAELGFPLIIVSGARCENHNAAVGGARNSYHKLGEAADIRYPHTMEKRRKLQIRALQRFGGIGFYRTFIHVDTRADPVSWTG